MWPQNFFGHTRFSPVTIELHNYDFRMVYIGLKVRNVLAFDSSQHKSSIFASRMLKSVSWFLIGFRCWYCSFFIVAVVAIVVAVVAIVVVVVAVAVIMVMIYVRPSQAFSLPSLLCF